MPNKYSYIGGDDLIGRMFVYEDRMKEYDLSSKAIKIFASALKLGNLKTIQNEFAELELKQKQGLLTVYWDYNDLFGNHLNLHAPMGHAIDLATDFGHKDIRDYFIAQKKEFDKTEQKEEKIAPKTDVDYENIVIKGLDKAALLAGLFNRSKALGNGFFNPKAHSDMTYDEAKKIISERRNLDFEYLQGRVMKIDMNGDTLNARLYDRDNGAGAAYVVIENLKKDLTSDHKSSTSCKL